MGLPVIQQYSNIPFQVFTIDDMYSEEDLEMFTTFIDTAMSKNDVRPFTNISTMQNGKSIQPEISKVMWNQIKCHIPTTYVDAKQYVYTFEECCKYVMFAKYMSGDSFSIHTDTGCEYDEETQRLSKFTVLTYLSEYSGGGGETIFYHDNFREMCRVYPKRGRTLIFDIDMYHAGSHLTGEWEKTWIGTELVCKVCDNAM